MSVGALKQYSERFLEFRNHSIYTRNIDISFKNVFLYWQEKNPDISGNAMGMDKSSM